MGVQEEAVLEREMMRQLLDTTPDYVYFKDRDRRFVRVSKSLADLFGSEIGEIIGRRAEDLYPSPYREEVADEDRRVIETGTPLINKEEGGVSVDGQAFWLLTTKLPRYDEDGNVIGLFGISRDVTDQQRIRLRLEEEVADRKAAETELQSQISLVDELFDATFDTIEIYDPHTMRYLKWNRFVSEISGYSDEEVAEMDPIRDFIDESTIDQVLAASERAMAGEKAVVRLLVVAKDGTRIPMEYTASVSKDDDGNPLHLIAIGRDITEQVRVEEALQQSEKKYRDLVETIREVIYAFDTDGVITYISPAVERLMGVSAEQVTGQPIHQFVAPQDRDKVSRSVQRLITGAPVGPGEFRLRTASGETRWIHTSSQATWEDGRVTGVRGALIDVTERKRAEQALQRSNDDLSRRVDELATLHRIGQTLSSAAGWREKVDSVSASVAGLFDAASVGVVLLDDAISELRVYSLLHRQPAATSGVSDGRTAAGRAGSPLIGTTYPVGDDPFTHRLLVERSATVISPSRDQASWALGKVLARELAAQSVLAAPLVSTDRVRGLLLVSTDRPEHAFTTHDATLAETVARLVANAMELDRLLERVQDRATQAERNRLARELHDSVTQNLYSIHLFANATQLALSAGKIDTVRENVRQIRDQGESALAEMRLLIFELQPPMLEQEGLPGALRERLDLVEARAGVNTSYRVTSERALPKTIEAELYAVATEALNNALKHSRAEQVSVALEYDSQEVRLSIADDGIGFDPEFARGSRGYGIRNMEERVERMNGRLSVETGPGAGTTVRVEVVA